MLHITRIPCGIANCYLIEQDGAYMLVDTGYYRDRGRVERFLQTQNVSPRDLTFIFLTHGHIDHAGSALYLREKYGTPLAMSPLEDDITRPYHGHGPINWSIYTLTIRTIKQKGPILPNIELNEKLDLGTFGFSAAVIALPGHTAGSMGLLFADGSLVCGDQYSAYITPRITRIAEDSTELHMSARLVEQLAVSKVYPGHGRPFILSAAHRV